MAPLRAKKGDLENSMQVNVQKKANFQVELETAQEKLRHLFSTTVSLLTWVKLLVSGGSIMLLTASWKR